MNERAKYWPKANGKTRPVDRIADRAKCSVQRSRDLPGDTPGDRGVCEKESKSQGSE
jgi:hypothetical protein